METTTDIINDANLDAQVSPILKIEEYQGKGDSAPDIYLPTEEGINTFPADLAQLPSSGFWRYKLKKDKWTKPPSNIHGEDCDRAGFNLPLRRAWEMATAKAKATRDGKPVLGIGTYPPEGYVGIDIDNCVDKETGLIIIPEVAALIEEFPSYIEYSPSKKGLHIWMLGTKPERMGSRHAEPFKIEIYAPGGNYLTVTGVPYGELRSIAGCQAALDDLCEARWPKAAKPKGKSATTAATTATTAGDENESTADGPFLVLSDYDTLCKIKQSGGAQVFRKLYYDPEVGAEYPSASEADVALLTTLAFWLQCDPARMEAWFRRSARYRAEKGDDYVTRSVAKAIKFKAGKFYRPTTGFETSPKGAYSLLLDKGETQRSFLGAITPTAEGLLPSEEAGEARSEWGVEFSMVDRLGERCEMMVSRGLMRDPKNLLVFLEEHGLTLNSSALDLVDYMHTRHHDVVIEYYRTLGWQAKGLFGLPDRVIGQQEGQRFRYLGDRTNHNYKVKGSLEGWKATVGKYAMGNPMLQFSIATSFAGPALPLLGYTESTGFNLLGTTSAGKSTCQIAAASVCGDPSFKKSWNTTLNGLENVLVAHNHGGVILDELGLAAGKDAGALAYKIFGDETKSRMHADTSQHKKKKWLVVVLSSGEVTLETLMSEGSQQKVRGGMRVRLKDIPTCSRKYGAFDDLHDQADGALFSNLVKNASAQNYGHPLQAWLQYLVSHKDEFTGRLKTLVAEETDRLMQMAAPAKESLFDTTVVGGEVSRGAAQFALVSACSIVANEIGILPWDAREATGICFKGWLGHRGGAGSSDASAMADAFINFIRKHPGKFQKIVVEKGREAYSGEFKGNERVGFIIKGIFSFEKKMFAELCRDLGYEPSQMKEALGDAVVNDGEKVSLPQDCGGRQRMIGIKLPEESTVRYDTVMSITIKTCYPAAGGRIDPEVMRRLLLR